jgi:hypothetical protein
MAMNKSEQERMRSLEKQLAVAKAFRFTEAIEPDLPIPERGMVNGWMYHVYHGLTVEKACTDSVHHHFGGWNRTSTQRPMRLYSSELLALRAGRHELEKQYAESLAEVDRHIEEASKHHRMDQCQR